MLRQKKSIRYHICDMIAQGSKHFVSLYCANCLYAPPLPILVLTRLPVKSGRLSVQPSFVTLLPFSLCTVNQLKNCHCILGRWLPRIHPMSQSLWNSSLISSVGVTYLGLLIQSEGGTWLAVFLYLTSSSS